jgi:mannose/cellobiose epimerase-like protein (N-acyl-D-glucosamine 2-epimerase family)
VSFNNFAHGLTLMGSVQDADPTKYSFTILLQNGQVIPVHVGNETTFQVVQNLDGLNLDRFAEPPPVAGESDARAYKIRKYIMKDCLIAATGVYQEHQNVTRYDARGIFLMHSDRGKYEFEETHWWLTQISRLADQWLDELFDSRREYTFGDYAALYKTNLNIIGLPTDDNTQETATLARLLYGLSSAYLLTGSERYLLAARAGVEFQRETYRHLSHDGRYCFWAFGRKRLKYVTQLFEASQAGDDKDTIPLYEQIYALAGLTQYYRITLDWRVLEDIRMTVRTFNDFFLDGRTTDESHPEPKAPDGYLSHIDYATFRPDTAALGKNQSKKNWNSIGDHLPAYLINLICALEPLPEGRNTADLAEFVKKCKWMLRHVTGLICKHFPDTTSKYVNERFFANWTPDHEYSWQQNRAVVGHNLKIAWNLTRVRNYLEQQAATDESGESAALATECRRVAMMLANDMAEVGVDQIRGGIFDCVERNPENGMPIDFVWGSTKDFWQQEQAILAYLILFGTEHDPLYRSLARRMMAFWNLFFLDHDYSGIFFRTTDDGIPVTTGSFGIKGGHSISGYHAFELNFLAQIYIRSYISPTEPRQERNFTLYFKPDPEHCRQQSINLLPDFFPPGQIHLKSVSIGGIVTEGELPNDFQINLQPEQMGMLIKAEFENRVREPIAEKLDGVTQQPGKERAQEAEQ